MLLKEILKSFFENSTSEYFPYNIKKYQHCYKLRFINILRSLRNRYNLSQNPFYPLLHTFDSSLILLSKKSAPLKKTSTGLKHISSTLWSYISLSCLSLVNFNLKTEQIKRNVYIKFVAVPDWAGMWSQGGKSSSGYGGGLWRRHLHTRQFYGKVRRQKM